MEWAINILGGIVSGLIASFIFFLATRRMKPKIRIASHVSVYPEDALNEVLRIKIVNLRRRSVSNLCVEVFVEFKQPAENGEVKVRHPVGAKFIGSMLEPRLRKDKIFDNAMRLRIDRKEMISALAEHPNGYLTVHVYAQDAVPGRGAMFSQDYPPGLDRFKFGAYEVGNGTEIKAYGGTYAYRLPEDVEKARNMATEG